MTKLSGNKLARNAGLNLVASIMPLPLALIAIPVLLQGLGIEKFGILTIAWALIGYAGILDLGIGRAITKICAESLEEGIDQPLSDAVSTGVVGLALGGVIGAALLVLLAPLIATNALHVAIPLRQETIHAIAILGVCVPFVVSSSGLRGILEAFQRFDLVAYVRISSGILLILAPVLVLPWTNRLEIVMGVLTVVRILMWVAFLLAVRSTTPSLLRKINFSLPAAKSLLKFGGWVTVSNVVGPLIVYFDRFVIAAVLSVSAVTYYTTPFEAITKLWVVPSALVGVLFPAFSSSFRTRPQICTALFRNGIAITFASMAILAVLVMSLSKELLAIWLNADFAIKSGQVLCWLMLGVMFSSIAQVPFALIQAVGRPDMTAKLHCLELAPYVLLVLFFIDSMGIQGAALAWAIRAGVDLFLLSVIAGVTPSLDLRRYSSIRICASASLGGVIGLVGFLAPSMGLKMVCILLGGIVVILITWRYLMFSEDRAAAIQITKRWALSVGKRDG